MFVKTDVSREADVENMVSKAIETFGKLDCAHNNVGIEELPHPFTDGTEAMWNRLVDVNLKGVWLCMKHELKYMEKHGGGTIVNTSSIAGLIGAPGQLKQERRQGLCQGRHPRQFHLSRRHEGNGILQPHA
jgi:NAD(P)-dependent dehydrogenase (short-subunit alcohol dehydrogenase family)